MNSELVDMLVSDVLASRPAAAQVFIELGMGCPGCPFAQFETVAEVARTYGVDESELASRLAAAPGAFEEAAHDHH